jgi:hypothetical protein
VHAQKAEIERQCADMLQLGVIRSSESYLWGRVFIVRTDHVSLKFLLDQRLSTIPQHQWVSKLLGFDFKVEYKPGASNTVVDALSLRDTEMLQQLTSSRHRRSSY